MRSNCLYYLNYLSMATTGSWIGVFFSNVRHIQVVLRLYSCPAEIFASVDVDATAVGYDGARVWASHRAFISFVTQSVKIDLKHRSVSYEIRLAKYAKRGFEIFFPEFRREAIDPTV